MRYRMIPAVLAGILTVCSLTGCGNTGASGNTDDINTEDLPYGSTISIDSSRSMTISSDKRFIDDALTETIYTYYHSIETKDGEAFSSVMFPIYHEYQLSEYYEDEVTDQELLESTYDSIKEYFGYDFAYSFIDITDVKYKTGESSSRDGLVMMLDQLAEGKDIKPISDETQNLYEMTVTRYVDKQGSGTKKETEDSLVGETLFAIQYQGKWYLMYG